MPRLQSAYKHNTGRVNVGLPVRCDQSFIGETARPSAVFRNRFRYTRRGDQPWHAADGVEPVNGWDGADAVIKASMAIAAASSRDPFPNPSNGNHHVDDFDRHRRDRSCLSLRVPAHGGSGNLEKSNMCLFVIRLASSGANGNTNWRYARNFSPFTGDTAIANVQDIFSDAALLDYQDGQLKRIVPSAEEILPGSAYRSHPLLSSDPVGMLFI